VGELDNEQGGTQPEDALRTLPTAGLATGIGAIAEVAEADSAVSATAGRSLPLIFKALRNENFFYFWSGNFLSNIGTWMQNLAQGWLILQLTESSVWLGFVGFVASAPFLVFTLYGGVIADRANKRVLLLCTQTAMMVFAFTLAGLAYFKLITIWQVALLAFLNGIAAALNAPIYQSIVPSLVRREDLPNAIALNTVQFNLSRILGPTLGGYAVALIGVAGNFFLNGLSYLAVIFAVARIQIPPTATPARHLSVMHSLREGIRYVLGIPEMRGIVAMVASISLFLMPFITFIPFFARNVLHAGERGLGFMMACSGMGALIAALFVAHSVAKSGHLRHRGRILFVAILTVMVGLLFFCYSRNFHIASALMFLEGFGMILSVAILNMSMQQLSTDAMRGRVMGIYATTFLGLPPVGILMVAGLSRYITAPHAIAAMTVCAMACFILVFARSRALREFD
jgi:MFS family permease